MQKIRYILAAFSMFSTVPVKAELKKEDFKFVNVCLSLVGLFIGALIYFSFLICSHLKINNFVFSLLITVIPIFITGGIHLDGFMDCNDAFASHKDRGKMLEIMKDSSIGAFACLHLAIYILSFFIFSYILPKESKTMLFFGMVFILSRITASYALLNIKSARDVGMGKALKDTSDNKKSKRILLCEFIAVLSICVFLDFKYSVFVILGSFLSYFYCTNKMKNLFDGITGDLAGWMLSISEIVMLLSLDIASGGVF